MKLRELFEFRSGRVIAVFRAMLALVFFAALMVEPIGRGDALTSGRVLIGCYCLVSFGLIAVAWRSWWFDQLLARPALILDIVVFLASVFLTERADADFTSPFLALFALSILSATLRWDWRVAAPTGMVITILFCAIGFAMVLAGQPLDIFRFSRRAFYMVALLLVLIWFGIQRREPHIAPLQPPEGTSPDALMWLAIDYATRLTGATAGALAWSHAEEPWIELREAGAQGRKAHRVGPEELPGWTSACGEVRLFDFLRQRMLVRNADNWPRIHTPGGMMLPGETLGIEEGLSIPIHSVSGVGLLVIGPVPGAEPDYVSLGNALSREIAFAFDRAAVSDIERESLVNRTRRGVARDLHDSVAQSLAGACFRLEALRRDIHAGLLQDRATAEGEVITIRDALRREQSHIRTLIETLRAPAQPVDRPPEPHDLETELKATLGYAGAHWGIETRLDASAPAEVPGWFSHEVQQLLREAVANAARHGKAEHVSVSLLPTGQRIELNIADDGCGFDSTSQAAGPWSISERVAALGGRLTVESSESGTRLAISLPAGANA